MVMIELLPRTAISTPAFEDTFQSLDIDFQKVSALSYWKQDYRIILLLIAFQNCD